MMPIGSLSRSSGTPSTVRIPDATVSGYANPDPAKKAEADRKAFKRNAQKLLDRGLIGKFDEWVWSVR
jgi:hypothetical protein